MSAEPSSPPTSPSPAPPTKPPRNPVERIIVWGGIAILIAIAGVEFRARTGHSRTLEALNAAAVDETKELSLPELQQMLVFSPSVSGPVQEGLVDVYTYRWFSMFKPSAYEIKVQVSRDDVPLVLAYVTPDAPEPEEPVFAEGETVYDEEEPPSIGEMSGGGGGGGAGSGRRPNVIRDVLDHDEDGVVSAGELEGAVQSLKELDTDQDGAISAAELGITPGDGEEGNRPPNRFLMAIDVDGDGNISAEELAGAKEALLTLDVNGDGALSRDDFRRPTAEGDEGGRQPESGESSPTPQPSESTPAVPQESVPAESSAGSAPAPSAPEASSTDGTSEKRD